MTVLSLSCWTVRIGESVSNESLRVKSSEFREKEGPGLLAPQVTMCSNVSALNSKSLSIFIPAAGDHGPWPLRNAPSCDRPVPVFVGECRPTGALGKVPRLPAPACRQTG